MPPLAPPGKSADNNDGVLLLQRLTTQPADPLLSIIGAYRADRRDHKIDVGVGVYRDAEGRTPILEAVKIAEERLLRDQATKGYLGPEGDVAFVEALRRLILGDADRCATISGLQTPGGTGALRLAAELVAAAKPGARVWVGTPTWPNHLPILAAAQLDVVSYPYFDATSQRVLFDDMVAALEGAEPGDVVLLQGCCHNPTGADLEPFQWRSLADIIVRRRLLPLVDLAYHGLGQGLDGDAAAVRRLIDQTPEGLLAYSCDKNFGLYRERTGALLVWAAARGEAAMIQSNLLALARANWSMPPDHGAAVVRIILEDDELTMRWKQELEAMRSRIAELRVGLGAEDLAFVPLAGQRGMFSTLPLTPDQVSAAREQFGIYMAGSGRINVAGLKRGSVARFASAIRALGTPRGKMISERVEA